MTNDHDDLPDHLSFSQRYGYEPLPEPMRLEEISDDLRREIWNATREFLIKKRSFGRNYYFSQNEARIIERIVGKFLRVTEDRVATDYEEIVSRFKWLCISASFNKLLEFLEAFANDRDVEDEFVERIRYLFEIHGAAYRLDSSRPIQHFVPVASKEQGEATRQAVATVQQSGVAPGAATHLRQAVEHLNAGRYADSIRESIHAVESVARVIDPEANKTLGPALKSLERAGLLHHPALREAFDRLYGYTNDEQGVRHALIERDAADVDVDDALFMYGACASFAAYLVNKHQGAEGT